MLFLYSVLCVISCGSSIVRDAPPSFSGFPTRLEYSTTLRFKTNGHPTPTLVWYIHDASQSLSFTKYTNYTLKREPDGNVVYALKNYGQYYCIAENKWGTSMSIVVKIVKSDNMGFNTAITSGTTVSATEFQPLALELPLNRNYEDKYKPPYEAYWNTIHESGINTQVEETKTVHFSNRVAIANNYSLVFTTTIREDSNKYFCTIEQMKLSRYFIGSSFRNYPWDVTIKENHPEVAYKPYWISIPPDNKMTFELGECVFFTCVAAGNPAPNVTIKRTDTDLEVSNTYGWQFKNYGITKSYNGKYVCRAKNKLGSVEWFFEISIEGPPEFSTTVKDTYLAPHENKDFEIRLSQFDKNTHLHLMMNTQPFHPGKNHYSIVDQTENMLRLRLTNATQNDSASFQVFANNSQGITITNFFVYVEFTAVEIDSDTKTYFPFLEGTKGNISAKYVGVPTPSTNWSRGNAMFNESYMTTTGREHETFLTLIDFNKDDEGNYTVDICNKQYGKQKNCQKITLQAVLVQPSEAITPNGTRFNLLKDAKKPRIVAKFKVDPKLHQFNIIWYNKTQPYDPNVSHLTTSYERVGENLTAMIELRSDDIATDHLVYCKLITLVDQVTISQTIGHFCPFPDVNLQPIPRASLILLKDRNAETCPLHKYNYVFQYAIEKNRYTNYTTIPASEDQLYPLYPRGKLSYWRAFANTNYGPSPYSNIIEMTIPIAIPTLDASKVYYESDKDAIVVKWKPITIEEWGTTFKERVKMELSIDSSPKRELKVPVSNEKAKFSGLESFTDYTISYKLCNEKGCSDAEFLRARTDVDFPKGIVKVDGVSEITSHNATVVFAPIDSKDFNGLKKQYKITAKDKNGNIHSEKLYDATEKNPQKFLVKDLKPFTNYTLIVTPHNELGDGTPSKSDTFITGEYTPGPVSSIITYPLPDGVIAHWELPKEPNGVIKHYVISWKKQPDGTWQTDTTKENRYRINDLEPTTFYDVTIHAVDGFGEGEKWQGVASTSISGIPKKPEGLAYEASSESFNLTWTSPGNKTDPNYGGVENFYVRYRKHEEDFFVNSTDFFENSTDFFNVTGNRKRRDSDEEYEKTDDVKIDEPPQAMIHNVSGTYELQLVASNAQGSAYGDVLIAETAASSEQESGIQVAGAATFLVLLFFILLLLLLILLVILYVYRNRSHGYFVGENERKYRPLDAENYPRKDDHGFENFVPPEEPNENTLGNTAAPRDSLASFDDPDFGTGYNEDGSFIGAYTGANQKSTLDTSC